MERSIAAEYGINTELAIDKFKKLFGYGYMFDRSEGLEIRVDDLDKGLKTARDIIVKNDLPLIAVQWGSMAQYRAFMVVHKEAIT